MSSNIFGGIAALGMAVFLCTEARAAPQPFSVERNAAPAERCFATYLDLAAATSASLGDPEKAWFSKAGDGAERMAPYVGAIAQAQRGAIYARVASMNAATKKALDSFPASSPERQQQVAALAASATECDRLLSEWQASNAAASAQGDSPNVEAAARSLLDATKTICVPYVVDGKPVDQLVQRPGIAKRVDVVNGVKVTRYVIEAPGSPVLTPSPEKDFGIGPDGKPVISYTSCWMEMRAPPELVRLVVQRYRDTFALSGYETRPPHEVTLPGVLRGPHEPIYVACVLGRTIALVEISGPFEDPFTGQAIGVAEVDVKSGPTLTASEGCAPAPPPVSARSAEPVSAPADPAGWRLLSRERDLVILVDIPTGQTGRYTSGDVLTIRRQPAEGSPAFLLIDLEVDCAGRRERALTLLGLDERRGLVGRMRQPEEWKPYETSTYVGRAADAICHPAPVMASEGLGDDLIALRHRFFPEVGDQR